MSHSNISYITQEKHLLTNEPQSLLVKQQPKTQKQQQRQQKQTTTTPPPLYSTSVKINERTSLSIWHLPFHFEAHRGLEGWTMMALSLCLLN